jgi:hypothetical protein
MSFQSYDQREFAQARPQRSLWVSGRSGRILARNGDYAIQVLSLTPHSAEILCGAIFQLGEPVVLTLAGIGHASGWIKDRGRLGIEVQFDWDPALHHLIAGQIKQPAPACPRPSPV